MSLITKEHLSLLLQTIRKLLTFKVDKSEVTEANAIAIAVDAGLVNPATDENGSIYTDENGAMYSL
jgi:hypothetical protein